MDLKKYLPFNDFVFTTRLSIEEVKKRLAENIEPKKTFRIAGFNKQSGKLYEGQILGDTFTIKRIINYRNSFLPIINGNISTSLSKTEIMVKMRLMAFVSIFISVWLGVVGLVCLGIIIVGLVQFKQVLQSGFSPMFFIPFGMFIFGCLLTVIGFKGESKKSKAFLKQLFEAEENH